MTCGVGFKVSVKTEHIKVPNKVFLSCSRNTVNTVGVFSISKHLRHSQILLEINDTSQMATSLVDAMLSLG